MKKIFLLLADGLNHMRQVSLQMSLAGIFMKGIIQQN